MTKQRKYRQLEKYIKIKERQQITDTITEDRLVCYCFLLVSFFSLSDLFSLHYDLLFILKSCTNLFHASVDSIGCPVFSLVVFLILLVVACGCIKLVMIFFFLRDGAMIRVSLNDERVLYFFTFSTKEWQQGHCRKEIPLARAHAVLLQCYI